MATITPTWVGLPDTAAGAGWLVTWGPMASGDVGQALSELSNKVDHADRSVQVEGNFGAAPSVVFEGSNDGVNFRTLNDPSITPLNWNTPAIKAVLEAARQVRPRVPGGDGTTAVTVTLLVRKLR